MRAEFGVERSMGASLNEIDSSVKASIAVDGRVCAVSDNGVLYALGTSDGRAIWATLPEQFRLCTVR